MPYQVSSRLNSTPRFFARLRSRCLTDAATLGEAVTRGPPGRAGSGFRSDAPSGSCSQQLSDETVTPNLREGPVRAAGLLASRPYGPSTPPRSGNHRRRRPTSTSTSRSPAATSLPAGHDDLAIAAWKSDLEANGSTLLSAGSAVVVLGSWLEGGSRPASAVTLTHADLGSSPSDQPAANDRFGAGFADALDSGATSVWPGAPPWPGVRRRREVGRKALRGRAAGTRDSRCSRRSGRRTFRSQTRKPREWPR